MLSSYYDVGANICKIDKMPGLNVALRILKEEGRKTKSYKLFFCLLSGRDFHSRGRQFLGFGEMPLETLCKGRVSALDQRAKFLPFQE